jgi:hypothetical protein
MSFPSVESRLPELVRFVTSLAEDAYTNRLADQSMMTQRVRDFFSADMMAYVEGVLPGWRLMASYADGQTLIHIVTVYTALLMCPQYQQAAPEQQTLMHWIVLLHDLAKVVIEGKRDPTHSFRSAALAGRLMTRISSDAVRPAHEAQIASWANLTATAITRLPDGANEIPKNSRLPEIMEGIGRLFGEDTSAALIVTTVLLHQSINVVSQWPQAAPLNDTGIQRYVSRKVLPLLKIMMIVDNDAWGFFDLPTKQFHRTETVAEFKRIENLPSFR